MKTHTQMLDNICKHKESLEKALGIPYVWIRGKEFQVNPVSDEKADLIFQDMFDPYVALSEATCFVLELKKGRGDHELLGQIKKYMNCMEKRAYGHWSKVKGIAVAPDFTDSGLKLLWKENIRTFIYSEDREGKPVLIEKKIFRKAMLTENYIKECKEYDMALV
jgi:hypothetical protein